MVLVSYPEGVIEGIIFMQVWGIKKRAVILARFDLGLYVNDSKFQHPGS